VPEPGTATLEVGCGEGRASRDLVARGHRVTGLDASPTLLRAADEADPASAYVVGAAEALPFPDATFDLVVAYNSLMDVADMHGLAFTFEGPAYPLREPADPAGGRWARVPMFLMWRAIKR
jgi:ubiquinone/menaquinone biosynthesis C-methylase UbiE